MLRAMAGAASEARVLIVDNEEELLELLGEYLRVRGLLVQTCTDVELSTQTLRSGRVDVVLIDPHLPGLDLPRFVSEATHLERAVATVVITRAPSIDAAVVAFKAGATDYLIKPFKLREAYEAVTTAARKLRSQRRVARMEELLALHELASAVEDDAGALAHAGRLVGLLRRETEAAEACVWLVRGGRWEMAAQHGAVGVLRAIDPGDFTETRQGAAGLVVHPIVFGGRRIAALAIAGGSARGPEHLERMWSLGGLYGGVLARLHLGVHHYGSG